MGTVTFEGASGFLVKADKQRGGMVVLPTIYGVNHFVRDFSEWLAAQGLTTLIWDIYPGADLPPTNEAALAMAGRLRDGPSLAAMSACVDHLLLQEGVPNVGAIGFCLGGRYGLLLAAREPRLGAVVAVYPSIHESNRPGQEEDVVARAATIPCPVQVIYPFKDHVTSNATFRRLRDALERRSAPTSLLLYPTADHGFMHEPGAANEAADRQSRPQISAFLDASLARAR